MKKLFWILFLVFVTVASANAEKSYYEPPSAEYPSDGTVIVEEYSGQMDAAAQETKNSKRKKNWKKIPRMIKPAVYNHQDLNAGSYYKRRYIGY